MGEPGIVETIKTAVAERTVSPLFASFALSWSAWNYRFLMAVISDLKFKEKIDFIDQVLFKSWDDYLLRGFVYPLVTTVLIIYAYPYPAKWTFEFWRKRQRELKMLRQKIDDETPLTAEESRELRNQMAEQRIEHATLLSKKDEEIAVLQSKVRAKTPAEIRAPIAPQQFSDISPECIEILRLLAKTNGVRGEEAIFMAIKKPRVEVQHYLDLLKQKNLIFFHPEDVHSGARYDLSEVGRQAVVTLKLLPNLQTQA